MDTLKDASHMDAPAEANSYAMRSYLTSAAPAARKVEHALQAQTTRYLGGRTFYLNGNQWIDTAVQNSPNSKRVQVKFNSDEYFSLLHKNTAAAQWLSLGRNVQFLWDGTIYEVTE